MSVRIRSWQLTDVGCVREHNEDSHFVDPEGRFFICSDGMGGHSSGAIASQMAVQELSSRLAAWPGELAAFAASPADPTLQRDALALLATAMRFANASIYERGRAEPDKYAMGCTADVVVVAGGVALCAHVGDSRQYMIRGNEVRQLTEDHSYAPPAAPGQPQAKGKLTSALGPNPACKVDTFAIPLQVGDRIVLCTDGLADYFPDPRELGAVIVERGDEMSVQALVAMAKHRGGADNITVLVLRADPAEAAPAVAAGRNFRLGPNASTVAAPGTQAVGVPKVTGQVHARSTLPIESAASQQNRPNRMGVYATSALFAMVPPPEITKLVSGSAEVPLAPGQPVPRSVKGTDVAWIVLDGAHRGHVLYPEALLGPQSDWPPFTAPNEAVQALPITRSDFTKYCATSADSGAAILKNVGKLLMAELRRRM